jgi:hypothetical protein
MAKLANGAQDLVPDLCSGHVVDPRFGVLKVGMMTAACQQEMAS